MITLNIFFDLFLSYWTTALLSSVLLLMYFKLNKPPQVATFL